MARRKNNGGIDPLFDEPQTVAWGRYAIGGGIAIVLGFIIYAAVSSHGGPQGPVPVIRADDTAWTRQPSEPGGMEIPNQDSTVFELMDKTAPESVGDETAAVDGDKPADETVDKPVDNPEEKTADEAVEKPVETAGDTNAGEAVVAVPEDAAEPAVAELEAPTDDKVAASEGEVAAEDKVEDKLVDKPVDKPVEKVEDKPAAKPVRTAEDDAPYNPKAAKSSTASVDNSADKPVIGGGGKTVQVRLGSVPGTDKSLASKEFGRLKGLSGGKLSGASPSYESVTLPKGSFVRINVSMNESAARSLCDTLSSKGAPCIVLGQ